jgi:hypothetical protein
MGGMAIGVGRREAREMSSSNPCKHEIGPWPSGQQWPLCLKCEIEDLRQFKEWAEPQCQDYAANRMEIERLRGALERIIHHAPGSWQADIARKVIGNRPIENETNDIQWKDDLPYKDGILMSYDELVARLRPAPETFVGRSERIGQLQAEIQEHLKEDEPPTLKIQFSTGRIIGDSIEYDEGNPGLILRARSPEQEFAMQQAHAERIMGR